MPIHTHQISVRLKILNPQRQRLGGTVDVDFKAQYARKSVTVKDANASSDIRVTLRRPGHYHLTVTPTDVFKPVSRSVVIPAEGTVTIEVVIDKGSAPPSGDTGYRVFGVVRDALQNPLESVTVKAFDKDIRSEQPLGKPAITDAAGAYQIDYAQEEFAQTDFLAADIIVRVYGRDEQSLKESDVVYNASRQLRVDINLSAQSYTGPSEFELTVQAITPFLGKLPPAELTEDQQTQDITFLTNKTGLQRSRVEAFALAFRFGNKTQIESSVFYGLIQHGPATSTLAQPTAIVSSTSLDSKATLIFAALMREDIDGLMSALQAAVVANIIPYSVSGDYDSTRRQLLAAQQNYLQTNPAPSSPANLTLKLGIAGLQGDQVAAFKGLFSANGGTPQAFWTALAQNPTFETQRVALLQSVFTLSQLTGEQMVLTDQLIKAQNIQTPADLPKLAANTSRDWLSVLDENKIQPPVAAPGQTPADQLQNYAAELEQNFTKAFPTPAFAARIKIDTQSRIPNAEALTGFLADNPDFDLLTTRIGAYLAKQQALASGSRAAGGSPGTSNTDFTNQLKKTQRIFKLSPTYAASNVLLGDNIDSAHKVYRMGQNNFVAKYGPVIGSDEAVRTYQKATQAHSLALALTGNLKSMSDASHLNVFPDYTTTITEAMSTEVPDLDTLFGHTDFCECDECRSVYGAASYLTDILHFLESRVTSINCAPGEMASVARVLLRRRPDLADIDLNCDNTNTAFPYIDIATEIMEDFIVPPTAAVNISFLPKLVQGPIDAGLVAAIVSQFQAASQVNVASLLTSSANVSDKYSLERLQADNTCVVEDHWIIRDQLVVLKATNQGSSIAVQLLHQTLLASDEINANPEYVNIPAYNILQAAVRPFSLPFDLNETEGELYLSKLGTAKPDLIDAFRPEHQPSVPPSTATQSDLDMAFTYWNVNQIERNLIFQADLANQNLYWGALAAGTSVELDLFMGATGLTYEQVLELLALQSINPAQDSVIVSADLSCDTTKKQINNITPTKFDIIHRFLRLWNKTKFTLEELDAIVLAPALGNGGITADLAWELQYFAQMQAVWSFSVFQYLAFFQTINTTGEDDLYDSLFQNRAITNPLNADFAIAVVTSASPPAISAIHKGVLTAALGLGPTDLDTLVAQTNGLLSLGNISYFYRMAQLSQTLAISLGDLLIFLDIINISPFTGPVTAGAFYAKWRTVISSQFAADDFNYVLRHQSASAGGLIPSDDLVATALADLQTKLLQAQAAAAVAPDPTGQLLKKWLTDPLLNWNPALLAKLLDILGTQDDVEFQTKVDNNQAFLLNLRVQYHDQVLMADLPALPGGVVFPDSLTSQISYDQVNRRLQLIGIMSPADQAALNGLSNDGPYQAAVTQLFQAGQQTSSAASNVFFAAVGDINTNLRVLLSPQIPARYLLFLTAISPVYSTLQQQNTVLNEICGWFKINKDLASAIEGSQSGIYTDFTAAAFVGKALPLTAANYPNQFNWYQKIAKMCFVANKLKLTAYDLTWLLDHFANIKSLDFWNLPITPITGPVATFAAFEVLVNILKFEQYFPAVTQVTAATTASVSVYSVLDTVINALPLATIEAALANLTGWDQVQLDQLINAPTNYLNLSLAAPADLQDIRILLHCAGASRSWGGWVPWLRIVPRGRSQR